MAVTGVQSVERALAILREVGTGPGGLVDLANRVGLPTSTTARLLATLEDGGGLRRDDDGVYRIGPAIIAMAGPQVGTDVVSVAEPHLAALSDELGEAVALSLPAGPITTTVLQMDAPKPVRAEDWTGTEVPLHAGCMGLATLAFAPDHQVDEYLAGPLERCTDATVISPSAIGRRLEQIRAGAALWTHGEFVDGLSSVAAPIFNEAGNAVAALYTYGPSYRYPAKEPPAAVGGAAWVADRVSERAEAVSAELGHRGNRSDRSRTDGEVNG